MKVTKQTASEKARTLLNSRTYEELAEELGITRVTLYARFAKNNWKRSELFMLENMK